MRGRTAGSEHSLDASISELPRFSFAFSKASEGRIFMRRSLLVAGAALAALGLTACNKAEQRGAAGSRICTPFAEAGAANANTAPAPGMAAPAPAADPAAALDDCLHRWGYTLAAATDTADDVAQAVVAACTPALTRWNQQALGGMAAGEGQAAEQAPSLLTGQPTTPVIEHFNYAQNRALFYVVQGRAGKCAPPPPAREGKSG